MIRAIFVAGLVAALAYALWIPAHYPPADLIAVMRAEYGANAASWGRGPALDVLTRALAWQDGPAAPAVSATPPGGAAAPGPARAPALTPVVASLDKAVAGLTRNAYVRGLDCLRVLALFRLAALVQWLPLGAVFAVPTLIDGAMRRIVKSKEFRQHHPELFIAALAALALTVCALIIACIWPMPLPPLLMPAFPCLAAWLLRGALANYHHRG
ncbi:DUF4400 domain-containing protein [Massilia sp. TS11]|uniref:DUF4400 domain-containing protein n=1 Tax=Massilia sp. TS11 TaxID=2908003 RepID=UPI001EDBACD3|nr:DUF4400 domain-containing protein [Massilia sp. TS11]MCG2583896.1 DUF4400 domain-containing protein [Massilia sp. TS11]